MKKWLAVLLSVMILFSGSLCLAESTEPKENADIQEAVVSVEGESLGTLSENIRFLKDLAQNEEVRELLGMEEVKTVTSEIIWRVLIWLYQNRPVTMKILAELGVKESDRRCIEKLWDSADRIGEALMNHSQTEDGRQLQAEAEAVKNDPDIYDANGEIVAQDQKTYDIICFLDESRKSGNGRKKEPGRRADEGSPEPECGSVLLHRKTDHRSPDRHGPERMGPEVGAEAAQKRKPLAFPGPSVRRQFGAGPCFSGRIRPHHERSGNKRLLQADHAGSPGALPGPGGSGNGQPGNSR